MIAFESIATLTAAADSVARDTLSSAVKHASNRLDFSVLMLTGAVFLCALTCAFLVFTRQSPDGAYTDLHNGLGRK